MSDECPWCDGIGGDCEECNGTGVAAKDDGEADDGWGNMEEQDEDVLPEALALTRTVSYLFVDDDKISERQNQLIMKCMEQLDVTYDEAGCVHVCCASPSRSFTNRLAGVSSKPFCGIWTRQASRGITTLKQLASGSASRFLSPPHLKARTAQCNV